MADTPPSEGVRTCIPKRLIVAVMSSLGILVQFLLKVSLSVIIVAMVKKNTCTTSTATKTQNNETCVEGEFVWNEITQGFVLSAFYYGYITTQLLGGWLSSKFGGKYIMGCGVALGGVFMILAPFAARLNVYVFAADRIIIGACAGLYFPPLQELFAKWFPPEEHQKISGMIYSCMFLANMLSMMVSGVLANYNWELPFYVYGSLCLVWFPLWIWLVHNTPDQHPTITLQERNYIMKDAQYWDDDKKTESKPVPWKAILTSAPVWAQVLTQVGGSYLSYTIMSELPTYMSHIFNYNVQKSGLLSAVPYLLAGVACIAFGILSQWLLENGYLGRKATYNIFNGIYDMLLTVIVLAAVGSATFLIVLTFVDGITWTIVCMVLVLTLYNAYYGGSFTNFIDLANNYVGICTGIQLTFANSMGIVTAQLAGFLTNGQQTREQWDKVFYIAAAVMAPQYLFFLFFSSIEEQPWNKLGYDGGVPPEPEILEMKMSTKRKKISIDQFPTM